jgi:hypothetical protein
MWWGGFAMAGQARIVLFSWVDSLPGMEAQPVQQTTSTGLSLDSAQDLSQRPRSGLVGWRVIAANNREMGRGASPAAGVDEAYQALSEVQLAFDRTETRFSGDGIGAWAWYILLGSEQVAVSSRAYSRQRECVYSVAQFREQFPTAGVVTSHGLRPRTKVRGPLILPPTSVTERRKPGVTGPTSEVTS